MTSLLDRNLILVRQKAKLIEVTNQYKLQDEDGNDVGAVNQVGQSKAKKLLRLVSSVDQFLTHKLEASLTGPLRPLAFAAAVAIDTALKQDDA